MNATTTDLKQQWDEQGYFVVRDFIKPARAESLRARCEDILSQWFTCDPQTQTPGRRDDVCMRNLNHPAYFGKNRSGLLEILEFAADPRVLDLAREAMGLEPLFRTTSLFFNPTRSRDGNWHRDSQFLTKTDDEEKKMIIAENMEAIQLQIALVPSEDSQYVPLSHRRWDTPAEYQIRKADGCKNSESGAMPGAIRVSLRPGDAVAFNPMGLHRGRYHADKLRRTFMLTYSSQNNPLRDWFIEQPWFLESGYLDGLSADARAFYQKFIDTFRGHWERLPGDLQSS